MKRGGPIARRTPMARATPMPRATPREASGKDSPQPRPRAARRRGLRRPSMDKDLRAAVLARSGTRCDLCGLRVHPDAWECHHRLLRSRGGQDSLANLIVLHPECHHFVHARPAWATARGFMVRSGADPAAVPVLRHTYAYWLPGETWQPTTTTPDGADA